jgi:hypothetical protein
MKRREGDVEHVIRGGGSAAGTQAGKGEGAVRKER